MYSDRNQILEATGASKDDHEDDTPVKCALCGCEGSPDNMEYTTPGYDGGHWLCWQCEMGEKENPEHRLKVD